MLILSEEMTESTLLMGCREEECEDVEVLGRHIVVT